MSRKRKRDEPVRLTRIYTRGGDAGETSLGGGSRVSKTDPRVEAVGEVDELNSLLGWSRAIDGAPVPLARIQNELFELGARLFVARAVCRRAERAVLRVDEASPLVAVYLNRLSDLLFVLARAANADAGEILWRPGASTHT